ncbi:related to cAMP-independent regulatory protein pac2 [Ustilago trichophora]|uniref:Related to cAMP-independent regulatory protein pac2 n=1 Tax=Ustilago trichophora TaxID=86804 RepID=A0A5C3E4Y3_9BASI|nr:related to cAMP-independent regulatory protein pac2 [Ustilago trichophora]
MPGPYSNNSYPYDRYSHHAEPSATMHPYSNRHMSTRPDFARSQTVPRGPLPGPPHGPMYPDHGPSERTAYPPHHAPHPTYTRHHHSYYDERGPLPPPPLHHRHTHHEDPYYGYDGRSPTSSSPAQSHAPYGYGYQAHAHSHAQHPGHPHPRHPHHPHHASFSSAGSSASSSLHSMRGSMANPMTMSTGSQQQPTYRGHIKTTKDAILLLAACDLVEDAGSPGLPPPRRVTRRLLDSERADLICSGSIFVWDEKEAGMRRWTDGKCWSASRVSGCFLTYRELEARKKPSSSITGGPTSNLYKAEGLIKQSFSMTTTSGRKLHVISYYTKRDVREGLLRRVSEDPRFVGENGGEWGLEVDEAEYPDPISRAGDLPPGVNPDELEGSQSPPALAHIEPRGEVAAHSRENSYHGRKMSPSPRSYVESRGPVDRSRISPEPQHHMSPHESAPRRGGLDSHLPPYGTVKGESTERLPYSDEVTPLHEARGLLPIRPIPVDSKFADLPLRRTSKQSGPESFEPAGQLYNRKRSYQDFRSGVDADEAVQQEKPTRPRLQRLRSSSMSNPHSSSAQDVLAPIRPLGRVGSDDEGVSMLRSTHTHTGGREPHDSAVGALLSLRSGSGSSDSSSSSPSTAVATTTAAVPAPNSTEDKASFSRMDRAALDRFSLRI